MRVGGGGKITKFSGKIGKCDLVLWKSIWKNDHFHSQIWSNLVKLPGIVFKSNHLVEIMGYGTLDGVKYWRVKNSYGVIFKYIPGMNFLKICLTSYSVINLSIVECSPVFLKWSYSVLQK